MLLAVLCIALATALHWVLSLIWADIFGFLTFYPAVVVTGLASGIDAGVAAIALAAVANWWLFIPPQFALFPIKGDHAASLALFIISSAFCLGAVYPYMRGNE
jgi:two-component system, sensor histidine kinase PdtaS